MASNFIKIGELATDTLSQAKILWSKTTSANYDSFKTGGNQDSGGTAYPVTSGKTLYIVKMFISSGSASNGFYFGYGDTSVNDSASAPTTPIQLTTKHINTFNSEPSTTVAQSIWTGLIIIPAGKYFWQKHENSTTSNITAWGFEV